MAKAFNPSRVSHQEKLKIAVLIRQFVTTGGAERYAVEVTRRLAREHDVHVFAQDWSFEGKEQITFHKIPKYFTRPSFLNQLIFSYFTHRSMDRSFDIIHTHERVSHFDVLTVHCPCFRSFLTQQQRLWGKMCIWSSVVLSPRKLAYLWLEKRQFTYNRNRLIIAVSENVKENVQANYTLPDEAFGLAYPGVDTNLIKNGTTDAHRGMLRNKLGIDKDDVVILFVGTEFKRKGLDALLKGFARMHRAHMKLVIAGGGKQESYVALAKRLGIENDVIFLGLVSNMGEVYAISDIYILPTLSDPAGMAPIEAMASGVATIMSCSEYAGTAEQIRNGEALLLRDPRDPDEIAASLIGLMQKDYRTELSSKGRQLAHTLTWEKTTQDTLSIYYKVLALKRSTQR